MPAICKQEYNKSVTEVVCITIDATKRLKAAELLTGTPTISAMGDMAIDNIAVTTAEEIVDGRTVAIGKAITARISGGTTLGRYEIKAFCATTSSPAQTIEFRGGILNLQAD